MMPDKRENNTAILIPIVTLVMGLIACVYAWSKPLGDFANYYYGAAFISSGDYQQVYDVHRFNEAVELVGHHQLFLDHTSVPPQTPFFYKPFTLFADPFVSRGIFNVLGVCCFAFMLFRLLKNYAPLSFPRSTVFLAAMAYPMYQNIVLGQTYLFIASLLIAVWLAYLNGRHIQASIWLALAVVLKITPIIILVFFIVRRQWRLVISFIIAYIIISAITLLVTGYEVFELYYLHLLPRIMDGYINDPYTPSYHGFVVLLRHLGQYDAVLNPHPTYQFSPQLIGLLNLILLLPLFAVVLYRCILQKSTETAALVLLLLFLFIGSGYFSTYSLLVLPPFLILHRKGAAPVFQLILVLIICAVPPRILQDAPVWIQHFKLYALLLLFALTLTRPERTVRMNAIAALLLIVFAAANLAKLFLLESPPKYTYFSNAIVQHYVTDYSIVNDSLQATVYSMKGKQNVKIPLSKATSCSLPLPKKAQYLGPGNLLYKNIVCRNDSVIFMCDVGRGVGLYHLYCVPARQFPVNQLK